MWNECVQHGDSDVCNYAIHRRQSLLHADGLLQHCLRLVRLCLRPRYTHTRKLCISCVACDFAMHWIRYTCLFIYVLRYVTPNCCIACHFNSQDNIVHLFIIMLAIIYSDNLMSCCFLCEINTSSYLNRKDQTDSSSTVFVWRIVFVTKSKTVGVWKHVANIDR